MKVMLERAAHCRSGDKGNTSNISVIAYSPELYRYIKSQVTAERFGDFYSGVVTGKVTRYEVDGLHALNFVAEGALGGGNGLVGIGFRAERDNREVFLGRRVLDFQAARRHRINPGAIDVKLQVLFHGPGASLWHV